MRVLVVGGRDFNDRVLFDHVLDEFHAEHHISCLIHAGGVGTGQMASAWAKASDIETFMNPVPGHSKYCYRQLLGEGRPMAVLAFPGERPVAYVIGQARAAGIPVYKVEVIHDYYVKKLEAL